MKNYSLGDDFLKKSIFGDKNVAELIRKAMEAIGKTTEMTEEEEIEDDTEGGYFQDEDD